MADTHMHIASVDISATEGQDDFLNAAFSTRHPLIISNAVKAVAKVRADNNYPFDESFETIIALFSNPNNAQHVLEGIAESDSYIAVLGLEVIDGL